MERRDTISNVISRAVSDSLDLINSFFPSEQSNNVRNTMRSQIVCNHCGVLLLFPTGASSVQCGACNSVTLVRPQEIRTALVNCGNCRITLMYPYGAQSVKCASCQYVTNITVSNMAPPNQPNNIAQEAPSTSSTLSQGNNVTVVVENPMSIDEKGKLVNNVAVGVTTSKK
ncbi:hypothetical protein LUZ60_010348 [Juncus effusus]|nr:hypothetical protein LUZ60_010348 [Juncus effusus]